LQEDDEIEDKKEIVENPDKSNDEEKENQLKDNDKSPVNLVEEKDNESTKFEEKLDESSINDKVNSEIMTKISEKPIAECSEKIIDLEADTTTIENTKYSRVIDDNINIIPEISNKEYKKITKEHY